jgi:hypothetical protein
MDPHFERLTVVFGTIVLRKNDCLETEVIYAEKCTNDGRIY